MPIEPVAVETFHKERPRRDACEKHVLVERHLALASGPLPDPRAIPPREEEPLDGDVLAKVMPQQMRADRARLVGNADLEALVECGRQKRRLPETRRADDHVAPRVDFADSLRQVESAANKEIVDIFRHAEVPVVLIDSDITQPPRRSDCDLVAINNISAGRQIAGHLYERGYRRIAFLMQNRSPFANANWGDRLFGLAGELALRGCEESVRQLDFSATDANALGALLRSRRKPDAIVCGNDEQAAYLMETLAVLGKHAPEDVAVVGFDDIALARSTTPPLTTISQPVKKLASTAFKSLLARIRYPNNDPREILLDAPLVVRQST